MSRRHDGGGAPRAPGQRQLRVGELVRRALSDVFLRGDLRDPDLAAMSITVAEVRVSPDLRNATVFVMPLGGANREGALAALGRAKGELRRAVSRSVALKFAPELSFAIDETFDRMDETRKLLSQDRVRRDLDAED